MSTKTEAKRSWSVYASDASGTRGELIAHAKSKSWSNVAKKWGFRKLAKSAKTSYVLVELRLPGRGEKPTKLYQLKREMTTPNAGYLEIAKLRGYKNLTSMPKVSIVGTPTVIVSNKRKAKAVRPRSKTRSRSASPKPKKKTTKRKAGSKPKSNSKPKSSSKPKKTTKRKAGSKPKKTSKKAVV